MSDPPERVWLVDGGYGWQEARVEGNGVEYIRSSAYKAEVERLREVLRRVLRAAEMPPGLADAVMAEVAGEGDDA
jgi:hypothetical protein